MRNLPVLDSYDTRIDQAGWDFSVFKRNPVICWAHDDRGFSGSNGLRKALRVIRSGEVLGLSEIVSGSSYNCTATTRTASRIGFVAAAELRRRLDEDPILWLRVAESLSINLGGCWQSMRSLNELR